MKIGIELDGEQLTRAFLQKEDFLLFINEEKDMVQTAGFIKKNLVNKPKNSKNS